MDKNSDIQFNGNIGKITELSNNNVEVEISFDITKQGHSRGVPRNYNLKKVKDLIHNTKVKKWIKDGYAVGFYGHLNRERKDDYLSKEHNATGIQILPICKTKRISISGNIITHTQELLMEQPYAKNVLSLMKSKVGGFSFVWNLDEPHFQGADYVLSPNFNGNRATKIDRVVLDSLCQGNCLVDGELNNILEDTITDNISDEIKTYALDLIQENKTIQTVVETSNKIKEMQKNYLDQIEQLDKDKGKLEEEKEDLQTDKKGLETDKKELEDKNNKQAEKIKKNKKNGKGLRELFKNAPKPPNERFDVDSLNIYFKKSGHKNNALYEQYKNINR